MSRTRFRYALQPVLLTRQWALDTLLLELDEHNAAVAAQAALQAETQARYQAAASDWRAMAATPQAQSVQTFAMNGRYLADLARQMREQAARMDELSAACDEVVAQVVRAQRALGTVERHRDDMRRQYIQKRVSADFKLADDQWNTLQTGGASHGH
ncbi:hypothetical protein [Massilia orientalis]|uniref:Uncharacterized protein n=1 Tax=Massilia orientalis TaxID=3050128 RepID=A0ACC7MKD3_9BURK|nr:hypothetical protein [Massilia sp. YIM B02787]